MEIIINTLAIWGPSLVAILGIVASVIGAITKVNNAISESKAAITEIRKTEDFAKLSAEVSRVANENAELVRTNKLLLDELTKIEGYADSLRKQ